MPFVVAAAGEVVEPRMGLDLETLEANRIHRTDHLLKELVVVMVERRIHRTDHLLELLLVGLEEHHKD
jgi:hypothetical protein